MSIFGFHKMFSFWVVFMTGLMSNFGFHKMLSFWVVFMTGIGAFQSISSDPN